MKFNLRTKAELGALRGMVGVQSSRAGPHSGYIVSAPEIHFYTAQLMWPNHTSILNLRKAREHSFVSKDGNML